MYKCKCPTRELSIFWVCFCPTHAKVVKCKIAIPGLPFIQQGEWFLVLQYFKQLINESLMFHILRLKKKLHLYLEFFNIDSP